MVFLALLPIIWLVIGLGFLKMPGYKACPIAVVIAAIVAVFAFDMPTLDTGTAALEGVALAIWPILLVIVAAIFAYNLTVYTKSMDVLKQMLTTVSKDSRILALLIGWGFGAFMEGMAGFGTAVAIPASILVGLGFNPIRAILACLIANTVPTTFGSIGIPTTTLASLTELDPVRLATYITTQLGLLDILCPFLMVIVIGGSVRALKGVFFVTLLSGLALFIPEYIISSVLGPELAVMVPSIIIMGVIVVYAKLFKTDDPDYALDIQPQSVSAGAGIRAAMIFILIFIFLIITSKLVPAVNGPLSAVKTAVPIYTGAGAKPYTFVWIATPGIMILLAAILGGRYQGASFGEIFGRLGETIYNLRFTFLTIITVVATAKIMTYSGMTASIAHTLVDVTGTMYPAFAPLAGALGAFITGSGTNSNVLFGSLQTAAAMDIPGADPAWLAACNSAGAGLGKMLSPQSIAIAIGAVGAVVEGKESEIMKAALPYLVGFMIIAGAITYFGQMMI